MVDVSGLSVWAPKYKKNILRFVAAILTAAMAVAIFPVTAFAESEPAVGEDEPVAFEITFDAAYKWPSGKNYGKDIGQLYLKVSQTVEEGSKIGNLPVKYRVGYLMTGWYTKKKGGKKISANTVVTAGRTYYAHWKKANAKQIAKSIAKRCKKEKTAAKRVQAATDAVATFIAQNRYTMKGKYYAKAHGVFVAGYSSCAGETRALGMVMGYMGYSWKHVNENKYTHQWVRVYTKKGKKGTMWADANFVMFDGYETFSFSGQSGKGKNPPYV
jgi:uncharacterized repeat protein (TIGR02543 family)